MLTPLTFTPIFKDKLWGGQKIQTVLGKDFNRGPAGPLPNCGESWEISGVSGNVSVVAEGPMQGRLLADLVAQHKGELVGNHVYDHYGDEFPLLIKFLDAAQDLSIQVHPDDALAAERHVGRGKTEMWYILEADPGATLNSGFNRPLTKAEYRQAVENNRLHDLLNIEPVMAGDVFFLPAGRVHYIGKGILLAEIQQTSDTTYRIYDFDRTDAGGKKRELHTELAIDAIDYTFHDDYKTRYEPRLNQSVTAVSSPYFVTNVLRVNEEIEQDYRALDSFVILIGVGGSGRIRAEGGITVPIRRGQSVLLPASLGRVTLVPDGEMTVLETYLGH
jgi:mannose-6-phosphate isomerase